MRTRPASLRNRLVLGAVVVGATFAILFGLAATWRIHRAQDQAVHAALSTRVELARDEVSSDGSLRQDAGSPKTDLVQVLGPDGAVRSNSPGLTGVAPLVEVRGSRLPIAGVDLDAALQQPDIDLALRGVPIRLGARGNSPAGTGVLVVGVDAEGFNAATSDLLSLLLVGLLLVVLAIAVLSWTLAGRALRSVTRLTESAEAVGPNDLATGLRVPRQDAELTRLVAALNRMLARLHASHSTELAFAADAGHRLRTPVATLRAEAELALRADDPEEQTAALERIVRDADQLTSIVDRMLARSRSRGHAPRSVTSALAESAVRWQRQAELAGTRLCVHLAEDLTDETRCAELVEILEPVVDNAVRHTPAAGLVDIDVRLGAGEASGTVLVEISNTGPGVPPDLVPRLFDAWVSSRDASVAGGLGLWLARETARDLGGDMVLATGGRHATTFRVVLPVLPGTGMLVGP